MQYLIELGFSPRLANLELSTYLSTQGIKAKKQRLTQELLLLDLNSKFNPQHAIDTLAGTIRISLQTGTVTETDLKSHLVHYLSKQNSNQLNFSLTLINTQLDSTQLSQQIKSDLKQANIKSRFVLPKKTFVTPIQLHDQAIHELIIVKHQQNFQVFHTVATTKPLTWQKKDRDRPKVDPKSGMLPPKIARLMVNLAGLKPHPNRFIFDPFCGSGTIIAEALSLGFSAIGSDISSQAIADSQQNLHWLTQEFALDTKFSLLTHDILNLKPSDLPAKPSAVVTEVDLGPSQKLNRSQIQDQISQHHQFYLQVLPHLSKFLAPNSILVIALPSYRHPDSVKSISSLIDTCENSGYTRLAGPINYSKPKSQVQRAIIILKN